MYERGLNLIAEADKDKVYFFIQAAEYFNFQNAKKAELWQTMQEARTSVENR